MADVVAEFFERFNRRDVDSLSELFGPGYTYAEPAIGRIVDGAEHVAVMRQYLDFVPDRRVEMVSRRPTPGGESVECRYLGTRVDGASLDIAAAAVFDIDSERGLIGRLRMYYELAG